MKFIRHLPFIGVAIGLCLLIIATGLYPGGTLNSASSIGFSWTRNFVSSLFAPVALNGAPNPARYVAMSAMVFLCVSLGTVFYIISRKARSRVGRKTIEIGGIGTAVYALVVATPMHNVGVSVGLLFSLAALFATTHMLYLERRWLLFGWATICISLSFVSGWMYYGNMLYGALPVVQKVSLVSYIGWLLTVYYTPFGEEGSISIIEPARAIEPSH